MLAVEILLFGHLFISRFLFQLTYPPPIPTNYGGHEMVNQNIMDRMRKTKAEIEAQSQEKQDAVFRRKHVFLIAIPAKYMDRFWVEVNRMHKLYSVTRLMVQSHEDTLCCLFALGCDHPGGVPYAKFRWKDIRVPSLEV